MNELLCSKNYALIKHRDKPEAVIFLELCADSEIHKPYKFTSKDGVIDFHLERQDELENELKKLSSLTIVVNSTDGTPKDFFEVAI
ncbi:hypothetical protein NI385_26710 (plasmid) [Vibrio parahaemolyticus]|nr:hypothetical protein NI385_26710 [Vibrio parahaemolyticus]